MLADGVLQSDDLVFSSPALSLSGEGGINIVKQTIDYLLSVTVSESTELASNELLKELAGMELSVPVRGPFGNLSIDFQSLLSDAFDSSLVEQINERKSGSLDQPDVESQKAALRIRLAKEREDAAQVIRENKELAQEQLEVQELERKLQIKREKDALKNKLQDNLKKEFTDVVGEK